MTSRTEGNSGGLITVRDRLMSWSGTGSWVTGHAGQLTDGSRGSRVTKCDPLSALIFKVLPLYLAKWQTM